MFVVPKGKIFGYARILTQVSFVIVDHSYDVTKELTGNPIAKLLGITLLLHSSPFYCFESQASTMPTDIQWSIAPYRSQRPTLALPNYFSSDFIWDFGKLPFPSHLGKYVIKIGKVSTKIPDIGNDSHIRR